MRVIGAAAAVVVGITAVSHFRESQALKVRFLSANPDDIPQDPTLVRYALTRGQASYREDCAGCHGQDLHGDRPRGVPNLVDADWLYGTGRIGEMERVMLYGIRAGHSKTLNSASMPAFATAVPYSRYRIEPMSPREVADVTDLVYSFQHPAEVDASTRKRGADLYHGKGLCFDCHSDHATGDPAIGAPNLTDAVWLSGDGSRGAIRASIERGAAGVCPQWIGRARPEVIRAIAVYVHSKSEARR